MLVKAMRAPILSIALFFSTITALYASELDQPLDLSRYSQTTRLYEIVATYPPPIWQKTFDGISESEFYREQKGPFFVLEQIPKGESFSSWSKLYAISAQYRENAAFKDFAYAKLADYLIACGPSNTSIEAVDRGDNFEFSIVFCQNTALGKLVPNSGYGEGIGQISVLATYKFSNTFIKFEHSWRGDQFDKNEPGSWPVDRKTLDETVRRFRTIELVYQPEN